MEHHEIIAKMLKEYQNKKEGIDLENTSDIELELDYFNNVNDNESIVNSNDNVNDNESIVNSNDNVNDNGSIVNSKDNFEELSTDFIHYKPSSTLNYQEDNQRQEKIEKLNELNEYLEDIKENNNKRCPICGSDLIQNSSGILHCEKINCYYSVKKTRYFKPSYTNTIFNNLYR